MIKTIAFDGDDTLWHHENYFTQAKDDFKKIILKYNDQSGVRDQMDATQVKNLDIFGYGVKGFTLSMIETAIQLTQGRVNAKDIDFILKIGRDMLQHPIDLLDGVEESIKKLSHSKQYKLMIITKGDLFDQESKVARSGLADYMDAVEIVSEKNHETYARIFKRHSIDPDTFLMVGNSVRSDILPIVNLGGQAIHIPYDVTWAHEAVELSDKERDQFIILERMPKVLDVLNTVKNNPNTRIVDLG